MDHAKSPKEHVLSPTEAQQLLDSVPRRPRRTLRSSDHLSTAATACLAFAAGLLALAGHPGWAILPTVGAIVTSHTWISTRLNRANEPRLRATFISTAFTVWLLIPVWRGLRHGETIPFPEALVFAGLAPTAWLAYYVALLIRR